MFDATNGNGVNPPGCRIAQFAVKVDDGDIYIDRDGEPG
jgi:nitrite reductase/ring-hydroxylating ferredoxin subunit